MTERLALMARAEDVSRKKAVWRPAEWAAQQ